jgi:hypothetical protein
VQALLEVAAGALPHLLLAVGEHVPVGGLRPEQHLDHPVGHGVELIQQQRSQLGQAGRDLGSERLHVITSS